MQTKTSQVAKKRKVNRLGSHKPATPLPANATLLPVSKGNIQALRKAWRNHPNPKATPKPKAKKVRGTPAIQWQRVCYVCNATFTMPAHTKPPYYATILKQKRVVCSQTCLRTLLPLPTHQPLTT